jgi:outer membrane protein
MKRTNWRSLAVAGCLTLGLAGLAGAADAPRVVFVDLEKVFKEYHKTKTADAELKKQADGFKEERKALIDSYRKLQDSFNAVRDEAQDTALNDDARTRKRTEAEEKLVEMREAESKIRRFDESKQKQLDEQSKRMRKTIVEEIREQLNAHSIGKGYSLVIDGSGETLNGEPVVLYSDGKLDITKEVLELLNAGAGSKP